jgi:hypothetical protein
MRFRERLIRAAAHVDASSPLASATLKTCESSGEWPITREFFDAKSRAGAGYCVARVVVQKYGAGRTNFGARWFESVLRGWRSWFRAR